MATQTNRRTLLTQTRGGRALVSVLVGGGVGALAYLLARGVLGLALFIQERPLLNEVLDLVQRGELMRLADDRFQVARLRVQMLTAQYHDISVLIGVLIAVAVVIVCYLWLGREPEDVAIQQESTL